MSYWDYVFILLALFLVYIYAGDLKESFVGFALRDSEYQNQLPHLTNLPNPGYDEPVFPVSHVNIDNNFD